MAETRDLQTAGQLQRMLLPVSPYQWRGWNGRLAVGIMAGSRLKILTLDQAGAATSVTDAPLPNVRYRALTLGPDGNLYVATDAGEIWRVTPSAASP